MRQWWGIGIWPSILIVWTNFVDCLSFDLHIPIVDVPDVRRATLDLRLVGTRIRQNTIAIIFRYWCPHCCPCSCPLGTVLLRCTPRIDHPWWWLVFGGRATPICSVIDYGQIAYLIWWLFGHRCLVACTRRVYRCRIGLCDYIRVVGWWGVFVIQLTMIRQIFFHWLFLFDLFIFLNYNPHASSTLYQTVTIWILTIYHNLY